MGSPELGRIGYTPSVFRKSVQIVCLHGLTNLPFLGVRKVF